MPAQAYGDLCTKYHSELHVGSLYCFSGCRIEKVRRTRSPGLLSQSRFLFIFGDKMWIEEKKADEADVLSFPMIHFSTVNEILDLKPGDLVDFVALIKNANDIIDKKTIKLVPFFPCAKYNYQMNQRKIYSSLLYLFYHFVFQFNTISLFLISRLFLNCGIRLQEISIQKYTKQWSYTEKIKRFIKENCSMIALSTLLWKYSITP